MGFSLRVNRSGREGDRSFPYNADLITSGIIILFPRIPSERGGTTSNLPSTWSDGEKAREVQDNRPFFSNKDVFYEMEIRLDSTVRAVYHNRYTDLETRFVSHKRYHLNGLESETVQSI